MGYPRRRVPDLAVDLAVYAALAAELADATADRAAALARHGLDEDGWEAIDDAWQARLSACADDDDGDGVPALVLAHAEAFGRAHRARAGEGLGVTLGAGGVVVGGVLSFERFLELARAMKRGTDLAMLLRRMGVRLEDYLAAQAHWTARMLEDEALAERFRQALR
jgi:hypothetical protein